MAELPSFDAAIANYYHVAPEESRLQHGAFQLEEVRTRELIERFAPSPPATVLDVGGAAGAYSFWLAERGYAVHLVDACERLVHVARSRDQGRLASCQVGDARALAFADGSMDAVLLLGPLYHLVDANDRIKALREAARVLRPGGVLFAAAISRWASLLDGLSRNLLVDDRFQTIVERDLRDGQHRNTTDRLDYFTTAYFHRPEELREEVAQAGLAVEDVFGIEGPGWLLSDLTQRCENPEQREVLLTVARLIETEPAMTGCSAHLLAVARRA